MNELTEAMVVTIKAAAMKMTGANRREFEAQATLDYLGGDSRLAETVFGWSRKTVSKGLEELRRRVTLLPIVWNNGGRIGVSIMGTFASW